MVAIEELRQGGGIAHFRERERRVGEEQKKKKCVYPEEDFISIRRCRNPMDVPSVKSVKI